MDIGLFSCFFPLITIFSIFCSSITGGLTSGCFYFNGIIFSSLRLDWGILSLFLIFLYCLGSTLTS
jgi:hypothetical protein